MDAVKTLSFEEMVLAAQTQEAANNAMQLRIADMMAWTCWCVTPDRAEVERIVRGECVFIVWNADKTRMQEAEKLFGYNLSGKMGNG